MKITGYGLGLYRYGVWFGFGQIQFRRWAVDLCLFKRPVILGGREVNYSKYWLTVGK